MPMKKLAANIAIVVAVCVIVMAAHWPVLSAKALSFDDTEYVTKNVLVQNPGWASTKRFFTEVFVPSTVRGYYQPLTMVSLMLDYAVGGREDNLVPFHRTSLALHAANTALVVIILYLLFRNIWIAAAVGLLFGVHPMTVESVAWIGDRKTLLAAFFSFGSLLFYILFARTAKKKYYVACLIAYLMALMSKPTSVFLPFVMVLMDYWPLNRLSWKSVREKLPLFVLFIVFIVITFVSQLAAAGGWLPGDKQHSIQTPLLIICHNIIFYPLKMLWPVNLSSHYIYPRPFAIPNPEVLADVVATVLLVVLLVVSLRWTRAALTGSLIFFIVILPTMQIIKFSEVIASDKFAYLSSLGILMMLACFLLWLYNNKPRRALIISIVILLLAGAEGVATRRYLVYWKDTISLFSRMLALAPDSTALQNPLAAAYISIGRKEKAVELLKRAIAIDPSEHLTYNELGVVYCDLKRYQDAIDAFQNAIRLSPKYYDAYMNLAGVYASLGQFDRAVELYKQAISINPAESKAYFNLGRAYLKSNHYQDAIDALQQAIRLSPKYADAYIALACVYVALDKVEEQIEPCKKAIEFAPQYPDAYIILGSAYGKLKRFTEAIEVYKQAEKIAPQNPQVLYGLGFFYLKTGDSDSALRQYEKLKQIDPPRADKLHALIQK
jgi:tetratricopeptide (TPR) repeat protein